MKDATPTDQPLFGIGPKAYPHGADVVALVRAADWMLEEHDMATVFISLVPEAHVVVDSVEHILVCILHPDPIHPGQGITDTLPKALIRTGVRMVMLNHAEYPIMFIVLEKTMQCVTEIGFTTAARMSSLAEVRAVTSLGPDLLVAEPTELIGIGKPSGFDYVEASSRAVREIDPGMRVLQGAGTPAPTDAEAVIHNGADATGSSSMIATAPDPSAMAEAMIRVAYRGQDVRPRSWRPAITMERGETTKVHWEAIDLQSTRNHPTFHGATKEVKAALERSGAKDGIAAAYNHHTTCSVLMQECSCDRTYYDLEYFQQNLVNATGRTIPQRLVEGQYMHLRPAHICSAVDEAEEEGERVSLDADAHLRSVFFRRSKTIVVMDGELDPDEFGYIYFVDWDQIHDRPKQCQVQIIEE